MKVHFKYERNVVHDYKREYVTNRLCNYMGYLLDLPEQIEIEFCKLGKSGYGETVLDPKYKNKIKLNCELSLKESLIVLVHELIHLEQIKQGRLAISRSGQIVWEKRLYNVLDPQKLAYKDYENQPWEQDVAKKQQFLLEKVLNYALEAK